MACYVIESDKQFICCKDAHVLEVYEIDSHYVAPVRQKHWTHLAMVHLGEGQEFEALKIGDRDIIRGLDLERLMRDLFSLGSLGIMMVNREGLCFLKIPESKISDQSQIEYLRMFDVFDFSKYSYVKCKFSVKWVRNDIVTGRPVLEMSSEGDVELRNIKRLHSGEVMEFKRKQIEDIVELKDCRNKEIDELLQKIKDIENKLRFEEQQHINDGFHT